MKKFNFSLDTVLKFKYQVLEKLKREHSVIVSAITQKENEILNLESSCHQKINAFNIEKSNGMSAVDALSYQSHIHILLHNIKKEYGRLEKLQLEESLKSNESIAVKIEISSLEKLREKRIGEYNQKLQQLEERFVEDFISNKSVAQKLNA